VQTGAAGPVDIGVTVAFDLIMDFSGTQLIGGTEQSEITLGGGFGVNFDASILQFASYDSAGLGDPFFGRDPDVMDGLLESGAFGDFNGLTGPDLVATMSFIAVAGGDTSIALSATAGDAGPFISAADFTTILDVEFGSADVAVVPVPAAVWFMLSGLGALVGFGRKSA